MAIAGIIENNHTWIRVVDPATTNPPQRSLIRRVLSRRPSYWTPTAISRGDFITPEVSSTADDVVTSIKTIAESQTVAQGFLGDPANVTRALVATLYRRLVAMQSVDEAVMQAQEVRDGSGTMPDAGQMIAQMEDVVADSLEVNVVRPAEEIDHLANQIKLLDLQLRMPQMVADLHQQPSESLETVSTQISALCDLPVAN